MSKKNWLLWVVINLVMGIFGYVLLAIGFIIGIAGSGNIYMALAIALFILLILIFYANRILYHVFAQHSEESIPGTVELGGNLLAWAVVIAVYLVFAFL